MGRTSANEAVWSLSATSERLRNRWSAGMRPETRSLLKRVSQVRILPGAPPLISTFSARGQDQAGRAASHRPDVLPRSAPRPRGGPRDPTTPSGTHRRHATRRRSRAARSPRREATRRGAHSVWQRRDDLGEARPPSGPSEDPGPPRRLVGDPRLGAHHRSRTASGCTATGSGVDARRQLPAVANATGASDRCERHRR